MSVLCPGWVNTRIAESDRNRPDALKNSETGEEIDQTARQMLVNFLESGMDPGNVAAMVIEAIKANRLYVLTHDMWSDLARARFERILTESG